MLIEACRLVHTERCQLMCKQRGRQQASKQCSSASLR